MLRLINIQKKTFDLRVLLFLDQTMIHLNPDDTLYKKNRVYIYFITNVSFSTKNAIILLVLVEIHTS